MVLSCFAFMLSCVVICVVFVLSWWVYCLADGFAVLDYLVVCLLMWVFLSYFCWDLIWF